MQRSVWLKINGSCLWVIGYWNSVCRVLFVFIFKYFFWSSPMSLYVGCSPFVFPAVVSNATCVSAGLTASKSTFGYHPSWIWAQSSLIHRIGWWEILNRKPLYLMVKTMVSAQDFPKTTNPWIFKSLSTIVDGQIHHVKPPFSPVQPPVSMDRFFHVAGRWSDALRVLDGMKGATVQPNAVTLEATVLVTWCCSMGVWGPPVMWKLV